MFPLSEDVRFLLQVGAPFVSAILVAWLSNRAHSKSRSQTDDIHRVVMNGHTLKKMLTDQQEEE